MKMLHISDTLKLPHDAVTQKFAFLGRTGSGKTYAAGKLIECMLGIDAQVIILDVIGVWYGLRIAADGGQAFSIPVFGGLHGDIPLEPRAGKLIAELLIERNLSAVLDLSQFETDTDVTRFACDFGDRLFHLRKSRPAPMHIVLEECQDFIPQNPSPSKRTDPEHSEPMMLHRWQRIAKQGRNFGIGLSLLSQRPQEVSKKCLNQTECLFAFQMTGPHERKAMKEWIAEKGFTEDIDSVLPKLPVGTAHVWSPQWLRISEEVRVSRKLSADVSATPSFGAGGAKPQHLTPVDIEALRTTMADTIERAKQDDPAVLKRKITELQKIVKTLESPRTLTVSKAEVKRVEIPVFKNGQVAAFERSCERLAAMGEKIMSAAGELTRTIKMFTPTVKGPTCAEIEAAQTHKPSWKPGAGYQIPSPRQRLPVSPYTNKPNAPRVEYVSIDKNGAESDSKKLRAGAERMLAALARWSPGAMAEGQLRAHAGLRKSGTYSAYMTDLRNGRYIEERVGDRGQREIYATESGIAYCGTLPAAPSTTEEVLRIWRPKLRDGARRMLDILVEASGEPVAKQELFERAGIVKSGTSSAYLTDLRTARLIVVDRETVKADKETLFL